MSYAGERHHKAKVPFSDIELMRQLHDEGVPAKEIAEKFEQKYFTVLQWLSYRTRING